MKRLIGLYAVLALCLPMVGEGQSIQYKSAGTSFGSTSNPSTSSAVFGTGQSVVVCNTADCSTNYERGAIYWNSNEFTIASLSGGTGSGRNTIIGTAANYVGFAVGGVVQWASGTAALYPATSDSENLGTAGALVASAYISRSIQGSKSKALTDDTATAFVRLTVADDDYEACAFGWTAFAEDADTDARQVTKGRTNVAILNNSGTETCVFSAAADDIATNVTAGSLACTFDCTAGTNTVDLRATCNTSLDAAAETLTFEYRLDCESAITTITPQ